MTGLLLSSKAALRPRPNWQLDLHRRINGDDPVSESRSHECPKVLERRAHCAGGKRLRLLDDERLDVPSTNRGEWASGAEMVA